MLIHANLIYLPYSDEFTKAGIAMACRSLSRCQSIPGNAPYSYLRKIVSKTASDLAFRRFLVENHIPHKIVNTSPFSAPESSEVIIGGRRGLLRTSLVTKKKSILNLYRHPDCLLQSKAVIEPDLLFSEKYKDTDIVIFAVFSALIASNQQHLRRALSSRQPVYLIYKLPRIWSRPNPMGRFGELTLVCETSKLITLEIAGDDYQRGFQTIQVELHPHQQTTINENLYSLSYLHVQQPPDGSIRMHSSRLHRNCVIKPYEWRNIWVYGMKIILVGYMTCGEFRQRALPLDTSQDCTPTSRRSPYSIGEKKLTLNIGELHPLSTLFDQARTWYQTQIAH